MTIIFDKMLFLFPYLLGLIPIIMSKNTEDDRTVAKETLKILEKASSLDPK